MLSSALSSDVTTVGQDQKCASTLDCGNKAFAFLKTNGLKMDSASQLRANICKYEKEYVRLSAQLKRLGKCKCLRAQIDHFVKSNCDFPKTAGSEGKNR